jgi:predicted nucleic acid-binding protein
MDMILDACSLINLINGGLLQKIVALASTQFHVGEILLEQEILDNVQKLKVNTLIANKDLSLLPSNILLSQFIALKNKYGLGDGETECIALCKNLNFAISTDDLKARKCAKTELGSQFVFGSLYLMRELVRAGTISCQEALTAYKEMITHGGFLPNVDATYLCGQ